MNFIDAEYTTSNRIIRMVLIRTLDAFIIYYSKTDEEPDGLFIDGRNLMKTTSI